MALNIDPARQCISGSYWTGSQLLAFGIVIQNVNTSNDICPQFDVSPRAQAFLDTNNTVTRQAIIEKQIGWDTEFKKQVATYDTVTGDEGKVDDLIACLLRNVLGNRFSQRIRPSIGLRMGLLWTSADPDVSVVLFPQQVNGVVVVEDKLTTSENAVIARQNAEAQMIAEGIAACQADNWPPNTPIYMLRCLGSLVSIYKAIFSPELLTAVANGQPANNITTVFKYDPRFTNNQPRGLNMFDPAQRQQLVQMLCSIEQDIITRFG
jgi:hypothetical protein